MELHGYPGDGTPSLSDLTPKLGTKSLSSCHAPSPKRIIALTWWSEDEGPDQKADVQPHPLER